MTFDLAGMIAALQARTMSWVGDGSQSDPLCSQAAAEIIRLTARVAELVEYAQALGAMPEGYCFCSENRIGDDSKTHEPECHDLRAALEDKHGH